MAEVDFQDLGLIAYAQARAVQEEYVRRRQKGESSDLIILCEHPPTITYTARTKREDIACFLENGACGFEVYKVDRGGEATYHGPGQLLVYPVINLPSKGLGVKAFTKGMLEALARAACSLEVQARALLSPAGIWIEAAEKADEFPGKARKVGQAGLRIRRGVTSHGFSLNVSCDLAPFSLFTACGMPGVETSSLAAEKGESRGQRGEMTAAKAAVCSQIVSFFRTLG